MGCSLSERSPDLEGITTEESDKGKDRNESERSPDLEGITTIQCSALRERIRLKEALIFKGLRLSNRDS